METIKLLVKGLITNVIFTTILFLCAGRMDYIQGWIFLAANIVTTLMNAFSIRKNSELAGERAKTGAGVKSWDKWLLAFSAIVYLLLIVIAGLDSGRFLWTIGFSPALSVSGVALMFVGQIIFLKARRQNNFFSSVVRIQKERGHTVCDTGLYKIVRHPGYLGMIISLIALPLITTSVWSIIPTSVAIILLLIRTNLEDKTLREELVGYNEFTRKTRYKLLPFIW